jgi:hypothetical protein
MPTLPIPVGATTKTSAPIKASFEFLYAPHALGWRVHTVYRRVEDLLLLPLVLGISKHCNYASGRQRLHDRGPRTLCEHSISPVRRSVSRVDCRELRRRTRGNLQHHNKGEQRLSMSQHAWSSYKRARCLSAWYRSSVSLIARGGKRRRVLLLPFSVLLIFPRSRRVESRDCHR